MTRPLERSTEGKAETKGHVEKDPNLGWCDRQGGSQGEAQTVNTRNELEMQLLSTWSGPGLEELKVLNSHHLPSGGVEVSLAHGRGPGTLGHDTLNRRIRKFVGAAAWKYPPVQPPPLPQASQLPSHTRLTSKPLAVRSEGFSGRWPVAVMVRVQLA